VSERRVTYQWVDCDPNFVRQRYDRLADIIPFFDWLFFIPAGLRKHAVDRLSLKHGDCVLDVGCGTGRNFPFLREAIGPSGRIYGVDLSAGMLRNARRLRDQHHWTNVHLTEGDAADYAAPERLDGVLFSLSYNTMPHHLTVLRRIWKQLRPGGRLVIMDSKLPPGLGGKLLLPFSVWMMRHTLLGNPYIRPWEHHAELVDDFEMEEFLFASYYVCRGVKPVKSLQGVRAPSRRRALTARRNGLGLLRRRLDREDRHFIDGSRLRIGSRLHLCHGEIGIIRGYRRGGWNKHNCDGVVHPVAGIQPARVREDSQWTR
jgi:ubiquinone/menaquinone biosynthesis C-methylase UbiE